MDTCSSAENFTRQNIFGKGEENTAYAAYFTGQSYLNPLTGPQDGLHIANATFEPGCRNNTGTFITPPPAADRSCSARPARAGIRRPASRLSA